MSKQTNKLLTIITGLKSISEEEKTYLLTEIKLMEKTLNKTDFKLSRLTRDRKIAEKLLNTTIEDLEKNQEQIVRINKTLERQKDVLKKQKKIIEEKSYKLSENLKKLELSYKEMEQFTYIASHDLKSPLRTIANFAQLLKRRNDKLLDAESKEYVDYIVAGVKQMHEVICDSLEYSRVGNNEHSFQSTDLNHTLEIVLFNLKEEIKESNAQIFYHQLPTMRVNKTSIVQLFQNLLGNSIKFRGEKKPVIHISCVANGIGYDFKVKDNGIGMDELYQKKAFLPFQRLDNQNTDGTGIGLAICKKIVKMHDGEIHFNSTAGEGTIFTFSLFNKIAININNNKEKSFSKI